MFELFSACYTSLETFLVGFGTGMIVFFATALFMSHVMSASEKKNPPTPIRLTMENIVDSRDNKTARVIPVRRGGQHVGDIRVREDGSRDYVPLGDESNDNEWTMYE